MDDAGKPTDESPVAPSAAEPPQPKRFSNWLFERRPPRDDANAGADAAEVPAEAAPEVAAEHPSEAEAVPEPEHRVDPEPDPAAEADADDTSEPETDERKARPRPWAGAPVVYDKPAVSLTKRADGPAKPDPIADFFARKDDDERGRWFRRKKGDQTGSAPATTAAVKPKKAADKPADKPAEKPAENDGKKPWPKAVRRAVRFVVAVAIAVVAALLLRSYVVQPYYVPSQSMEPTLHGCPGCNDDHVLVEKLSYRFHDVQAGDIVVFSRPDTWPARQVPDDVLIKRVIGVAGDRLTLKHGRVFRNGQRLDESYVNQKCRHGTTDKTGSTAKKTYPRIPNGEVFVMGDNRCDSEDSRFFGDVPTSDIIGRAFLIIWPVGRIHSLN